MIKLKICVSQKFNIKRKVQSAKNAELSLSTMNKNSVEIHCENMNHAASNTMVLKNGHRLVLDFCLLRSWHSEG